MLCYLKTSTSNVNNQNFQFWCMNSPSLGNLHSLIDSKISWICFPFVTGHGGQDKSKTGKCVPVLTLFSLPWDRSGAAGGPNMYSVQVKELFKASSDHTCDSSREKCCCWSLWYCVAPHLIHALDMACVNHGGHGQHNLGKNPLR